VKKITKKDEDKDRRNFENLLDEQDRERTKKKHLKKRPKTINRIDAKRHDQVLDLFTPFANAMRNHGWAVKDIHLGRLDKTLGKRFAQVPNYLIKCLYTVKLRSPHAIRLILYLYDEIADWTDQRYWKVYEPFIASKVLLLDKDYKTFQRAEKELIEKQMIYIDGDLITLIMVPDHWKISDAEREKINEILQKELKHIESESKLKRRDRLEKIKRDKIVQRKKARSK
jgi:hypothetical protein